jgi:hypothetical protein
MNNQTLVGIELIFANIAWGAGASVSTETMEVFPPEL